jgi:hypothetical protein
MSRPIQVAQKRIPLVKLMLLSYHIEQRLIEDNKYEGII